MPTKAQLERVIVFAVNGLAEAESQLAIRGCWCPGAGDEQCTLCIVREVQQSLKRRTLPGDHLVSSHSQLPDRSES